MLGPGDPPVALLTGDEPALPVVAGTTISSALVAFAFAYFRFPYRNVVFGIVLASMMLPGAVTMIPNFLIWNALGYVNTLEPLWAANIFASPFYIFLLRQFFLTIPRDYDEAAKIDGANSLQVLWEILVPLCRPAITTVVSWLAGKERFGWMRLAGLAIGGAAFLSDFALAVMGRFRGGQAKIAIVSSSLFGNISGSAVANVMVDGDGRPWLVDFDQSRVVGQGPLLERDRTELLAALSALVGPERAKRTSEATLV